MTNTSQGFDVVREDIDEEARLAACPVKAEYVARSSFCAETTGYFSFGGGRNAKGDG